MVNGHDVRVLAQRRDCLGLPLEQDAPGGIRRAPEELDGHIAAQGRIVGLVDLAEAAFPDQGYDLVGADRDID